MDYKDVTEAYVAKGISPVLAKYLKQYNDIEMFIKDSISNMKIKDKQQLTNMQKKIAEIKKTQFAVYKNLLDIYGRNGLNIEKIANSIKLKSDAQLAVKTLSTLLTFF